jgi:hypothetical protein
LKRRSKDKKKTKQQSTLVECFGFEDIKGVLSKAIEASGDTLQEKDKGNVRFLFQNVNDISLRKGLSFVPEIATIGALQLDVAGFNKTNTHWNQESRGNTTQQLYSHLGNSRIICAQNASTTPEDGYQSRRAMLAVVGQHNGCICTTGSDPCGRFVWTKLRRNRDEGICVVSVYCVSQTKGMNAGPTTAYLQQINDMIKEGDMTLDPRSRILTDLRELITNKTSGGFRPILMIDATDEWLDKGRKEFQLFVDRMNLIEPLHQKYGNNGMVSTAYFRGKRRIDFILVDAIIVPEIKRLGTLELHKENVLDHVILYMDCNENQLFSGIINRPVLNPSWEFAIGHADTWEKFVDTFCKYTKEKKFARRVQALSKSFEQEGPTNDNVNRYQVLDTKITECILSSAKTVAKKKCGYQGLPTLTQVRTNLHFWKAALSAKYHRVHLGKLQLK